MKHHLENVYRKFFLKFTRFFTSLEIFVKHRSLYNKFIYLLVIVAILGDVNQAYVNMSTR